MPSSTGQAIREELKKWGLIRVLGTTTAASGGANRLRDTTRLQSVGLLPEEFRDCYVRATSGTEDGVHVKVDYLDQDNGDLYVSPSFSAAVATSVTYEVWRAGIDPDDVDRARDEALTRVCSQWALQPLSELTNADWEDALGSTWAATSASAAIQTLSFPSEVWRNSILVTNSGANGRISSTSLYTRPSRRFYCYVPVSARTGTAELVVRDVTNGANISLSGPATTVTGRGWTAFEVTGQVPAACYEIQVWLRGQGASDVVEWGPVCFHFDGQQQIALPARVASRKLAGNIYRLTDYMVAGSDDHWGQDIPQVLPGVRVRQVQDGVAAYFTPEYPLTYAPHFFEERIYYDALSTNYMTAAQRVVGDAATTLCPPDYVVAAMVKLLAEDYLPRQPGDVDFWSGQLAKATEELAELEKLYGPEPKPRHERDRHIYIPSLQV